MADQSDLIIKRARQQPDSDQTSPAAGPTQSNKAESQTETLVGSYSYSTLDDLRPSATGLSQYTQGIATIVHNTDAVIGVMHDLQSSLPDNSSPAGSSPLNSASDGSGSPPTSTPPGSTNSTPGSNQPQDPTNGGGASGGSGGGGSNGGLTSSPGDGPDDGPNRGNDQQNNASPADQKLSEVIGAIEQVAAAVESGRSIQPMQLVDLQVDMRELTNTVKDSTEQSRPTAQAVEQLGNATERFRQAIEAQKENGKQVDTRLAKIAEEVTKLTEGLASIRIDDIVSGIGTIRVQLESGAQIDQDLLKELIAKAQASNGPVKLDETQLQTLTEAIAKLEKGQADQQARIAGMGGKVAVSMPILLEALVGLRERLSGPKDDSGKVRSDFPFFRPEHTQPILNYLYKYQKIGDPTFNPGCLEPGTLLELLSDYQKDPTDPDRRREWEDPRSEYKTTVEDFDAFFDKEEFEKAKTTEEKNETAYGRLLKWSSEAVDPSCQDPLEKVKDFYTKEYNPVRFLHLVIPPIIDRDRFCVTYLNHLGKIVEYDVSASDFYNEREKSSLMARWAYAVGIGGAIGTMAVGSALALATSVPLAVGASLATFLAGGIAATYCLFWSDHRYNNAQSKYKSLVFDEMLDKAGRGLSAPSILLPILAHMHFVQQIPEEALIKKYGTTDRKDNSPFTDLAQHIGAMSYLVKNWNSFETRCPNLNSRIINEAEMTLMREKNIDQQYLTVIRKAADELAVPLLRWQKKWNERAESVVAVTTLGLSELLRDARFIYERVKGPWGFGRD